MSGPLAVVDQAPQVRALFERFSQVNDPVVSEFTESIPEKFADAVNRVASQKALASDFVLRNRVMLKSFIKKFHSEAGTLTDRVRSSIELLDDPTARIVVSTHQPNLFAYGGVFKKIVLLEALKNVVEPGRDAKVVNLFLVVDHDFVDESWVRLAQLPSMQHSSGVMELRLPVSESKRWQMVCNMPVPGQTVVHGWKRQIKSWIKKSAAGADKNMLVDNLEQFWQHVDASHARAKSYADLNSFLMSRVVNETWNYSTLFVRLSEISTVFENGFTFLISNSGMYSDALKSAENMFMSRGIDTGVSSSSHLHAPVWVHCKCGSKASAKIARKNGGGLVLAGPCMSCKKEMELDLGNPDNLDLGKIVHDLSPRAIPIPLLLARDLGISCYASGTGGIGYLVDGSVVSKKLGIGLPLVLVWPSRDAYQGIGQAEALASTPAQDIDLYLQSLQKQNAEYEERIRPLLSERAEKIKAGSPAGELLSQLFELKEGQRRVRQQISTAEKIRNAVSLSPCFVDYAVNFGMARTEQAWRNHLAGDGDLAAPVTF